MTQVADAKPNPWAVVDPSADEGRLWLRWLVLLRWVALVAQLFTLSFTFTVLAQPEVLVLLGSVMLALALLNVESTRVLRRGESVSQTRLVAHLATEIAALTLFLGVADGAHNPFVVLYLIHIAMAAVMLRRWSAIALTGSVLGAFLALHFAYVPLAWDNHSLPGPVLRQVGHGVGFVATALSIAGFVIGLSRTLRQHRAELLSARDRTARTDRLRTVGTLAAGAAHELNTPLFTIDLRLRRVARRHTDADTTSDLEVIKGQLQRCKAIVEQLLVGAGDPTASEFEARDLAELVGETVQLWAKGSDVGVHIDDDADGAVVEVPRIAFSQALINLLENGREAQLEAGVDTPLTVRLEAATDRATIVVRDQGIGLPAEPDRVGDPFFTTKDTGTGLGVYVARAVADGVGGGLSYRSEPGAWTEARWWFPLHAPLTLPRSPP